MIHVTGNSSGAQGLTFFFKINGYPVFMKGSNWIPTHILPEMGTIRHTGIQGFLFLKLICTEKLN